MANISGWEKFRKAVTGSYSEKLTFEIAREEAELKAKQEAARARLAAQQAKARAEEEAFAKAKAESARVAKVKADAERVVKNVAAPKATPAKKAPAKKLPKDGDGDGKIFDGTAKEQPAPKKAAPTTKKKSK